MISAFQRVSTISLFRKISAAAALALLVPMRADAQQSYEASQVYMLPVYCKYTQVFRDHVPGGNNRPEIDRWTATMGGSFNNMHHYCWGLMATNRAAFMSNTRQDRMRNLNDSLGEFDYVIERVPPEFALLPEILTRKGENLIQLDRGGEGVVELQRAIKIKPNYAPPYAAIADFYKETGQIAKAREWLEKGLAAAPDSKALARRMADLDSGKGKRKKDPRAPADR